MADGHSLRLRVRSLRAVGQQPLSELLDGLGAALQAVLSEERRGNYVYIQILLRVADGLLFLLRPLPPLQGGAECRGIHSGLGGRE